MRTITILSGLYHELQGIAAKHSFYSLPHFVAFIMVIILQSEESEIELNTENKKPTKWGISSETNFSGI